MGCCGGRDKEWVKPAQKWDYINLNDFRSTSCFTPLSYGILWIMLGVSVACYVADFSTMINLLLWNKFGANGITPPAPFGIEALPRWVFTGCIILSYILLAYRWWRAVRAMKSGGVAKSYLDPLAARIQSIRPGKEGRGWRRFLVFAELTKSKHGTEYIALFVHFAFEAWLRIIFAEGPRNAINGYTIYHMITVWADVDKSPDKNAKDSTIQKFWAAALAQADNNHIQAAVFIGMVFTIVIWVIAFIGLVVAVILYVMFLWHHIPRQDGGLRGYCKRKVDKSVEKIVSAKIKQALEDEQKQGFKKDKKHKGGLQEAPADLKRQPTLPVLMDEEAGGIPPYGMRPGSSNSLLDKQPSLPDLNTQSARPGMPKRNITGMSTGSYGSDAPLLEDASPMAFGEPGRPYSPGPGAMIGRAHSPGNGRSASPAPPRPFTPTGELVLDRAASPGPRQSLTPSITSQRTQTQTPAGVVPPFAPGSYRGPPGPPSRQNTGFSDMTGRSSPGPGQMRQLTPANGMSGRPPIGPGGHPGMARTGTGLSAPVNGRSTPMQGPPRSNTAGPGSGPGLGPNMPGRQSPGSFSRPGAYPQHNAGPVQEYEMQPQPRAGPPPAAPGSYQAYRPSGPGPNRPSLGPPQHSFDQTHSTYGDSLLDEHAGSDVDSRHSSRMNHASRDRSPG